jgi:glucuronate isomerase
MRLETAIRKIYEQGFRARNIPRTYKILQTTDDMVKEMSDAEDINASEIIKASVLCTYSGWKQEQEAKVVTMDIPKPAEEQPEIPEV